MQNAAHIPEKIGIGELKRLKLASSTRLYCQSGWLLVTIEGDVKDYELGPGQVLRLPAKRLVIVEGDARYILYSMLDRLPWRGILRLLTL
jgi:hypothetical protein